MVTALHRVNESLYPARKEGALGIRAVEITAQNIEQLAADFEEDLIWEIVRGGSRMKQGFLCSRVINSSAKLKTRRKVVLGDFVVKLDRVYCVMEREVFELNFSTTPKYKNV